MTKAKALPPITEVAACPHCGGEEFFVKMRYSGSLQFARRFDGYSADNTDCGILWITRMARWRIAETATRPSAGGKTDLVPATGKTGFSNEKNRAQVGRPIRPAAGTLQENQNV